MIKLIPANCSNIDDIRRISAVAWPAAFDKILSPEQIEYMMEMMYSDAALLDQMERREHRYILAVDGAEGACVGYMAYETDCDACGKTKIHKIYLLPDCKNRGIGRLMVDYAADRARENGDSAVYLNVNKYNSDAIAFYRKTGFRLVKDEVIDIGNGFVMDDYVFEIELTPKKN